VPETRTCPACRAALHPWREVEGTDPALAGTWPLLRCARCGTAVTGGAPPGEDPHAVGAYGGTPRLAALARPLLGAFDRRRARLLARALDRPDLQGVRVLDAGAGRGRFVAYARAAGAAAEGLEPSRRGADAASARYGVALRRERVEEASFAPQSFDAVTLWHVLEHVDDPDPMLAAIARWLRPGGVLLAGVPNLDSIQARVGGARWYHLDVPRHRVHYTPAGLRVAVQRHGLRPRFVEHRLLEHNPFGMWVSAVSRLTDTPSYAFHLLQGNASAHSRDLAITLAALPLAPLAALAELGAAAMGRGGTIALAAVRG
jgi:SAM-dependent methyltransferase